jgi:hypothetical protein
MAGRRSVNCFEVVGRSICPTQLADSSTNAIGRSDQPMQSANTINRDDQPARSTDAISQHDQPRAIRRCG